MARLISMSVMSSLPPCGGILRSPVIAVCVSPESPRSARFAHAFLSPTIGAPSRPVAWHVEQVASYTCRPSRAGVAESAASGHASVASAARMRVVRAIMKASTAQWQMLH
jgi:hypothetical protein